MNIEVAIDKVDFLKQLDIKDGRDGVDGTDGEGVDESLLVKKLTKEVLKRVPEQDTMNQVGIATGSSHVNYRDSGGAIISALVNDLQFSTGITPTYSNGKITLTAPDTGNVVGPATSVDNRVVFFDGTTGKLIKDSGLTLSGSNTGDQTIPTLASGVYTPTDTAHVNLTGNDVTMTEAQYMRVGSTVTVSGRFTGTATLTATTTSFEITLPVASNIGAVEDVAGTAFCGNIVSMGAEVTGVVANDTAKIIWKASDITSQSWSYQFTYQII